MPDLFTDYPSYWRAETEQPGTSSTVNITLYRLGEGECHTVNGFYYPWSDEYEWYKIEARDFSSINKNPHSEIPDSGLYERAGREDWLDAISQVIPDAQDIAIKPKQNDNA